MNQFFSLRRPSAVIALVLGVSLISTFFAINPTNSVAQTSFSQCNGVDNVGGEAVECHYTVTNNLNGSVTSSRVVLTECHGAANDPPTMVCTSSVSTSTDLVTAIDQCNGSGNGGGGTVLCEVDVINRITGTVTATAATVNQCNSSGTGGGTVPTTLCDPFPANTTGANVTQCNGSGNGGGGTMRVQCSVDSDSTTTSLLNVTVNQCNGSGNEGGATVTCRTGLTNIVTAAGTGGSPSPTPDDDDSDDDDSDDNSDDDDSDDNSDDNPGDDDSDDDNRGPEDTSVDDVPDDNPNSSSTTSQVTQIPVGGAAAGGGSTSDSGTSTSLLLGLALLALAGSALVVRRRVGNKA